MTLPGRQVLVLSTLETKGISKTSTQLGPKNAHTRSFRQAGEYSRKYINICGRDLVRTWITHAMTRSASNRSMINPEGATHRRARMVRIYRVVLSAFGDNRPGKDE